MAKFKSTDSVKATTLCPCGLGASYLACCGRYISGAETAPTAQALMQSRYTAYTLDDQRYIRQTWHPDNRPQEYLERRPACQWLGLSLLSHHPAGLTATVEFIARYKINGRAERIHEISRFVCEDGQWLYVDGQFPD